MTERNGRVLIVDDSEDDQLQLRRILRREFQLTAAFTGQEALARLERAEFDALITDQKMPRMSGDALISAIKDNPRTAGLRCILLSGRTSDEQLVEILAGGKVFHYFEKHKSLLTEDGRTELILSVRNAVQASRLEQDRGRLTARLEAQVDAVGGQYRLLRTLVDIKDPAEAIRLVSDSLRRRLRCRAVVSMLDLRPQGQVLGFGSLDAESVMTRTEFGGWCATIYEAFDRLVGSELPDDFDFTTDIEPMDGSTANAPRPDAPSLPVFVDRDLRGLVLLVREDNLPLESDEQELFEIWRDQLQDALTRLYTRRLDELRRIELMVEAMTEGVVLADETGTVTLLNPVAHDLLGISDGERPDFSEVIQALGLKSLDLLRQLGRGDRPTWRETRRGDRFLEVLFSQVRDHGGRSVGMLTVIRDVSVLKRADRAREDFVHIISHELRSPLTSIGGVIELMGKGLLGPLLPKQHEYLNMAQDACKRLNGLVDDMLDLAKMEQGKLPLQFAAVHLEQVVHEAVRNFEPLAIERGVTLAFDCPLEGLYCQADSARLGQVMSNLLSNAFKFTPKNGSIRVSVLSTFAVPDLYVVAVHNSGAEIPEDALELIFKPFEQGQPTRMPGRPAGTGLGLSICRTVIQGHQGEIWVESAEGQGTTFLFSLPAVTPEAPERADEARPSTAPTDRPVLVISSDVAEAYAVKAHLLGLGFRVRVIPPTVDAVRAAFTGQAPFAALCVDVEGTLSRSVLAELATHQQLAVIALLPLGSPPLPAVDLVLELPHDMEMLGNALNVVVARQRERRRLRVLVADGDEAWGGQLASWLDAADYLAYVVRDAEVALARIERVVPDLVVIDRSLPGADAVRQRLAAETEHPVPVLETDARPGSTLTGPDALPRGATRAEVLFQIRARLTVDRQPGIDSLSILPGAREVQREIQARLRDQHPFACGIIEVEGLEQGIERLGTMWGHQVMAQTAELVHQVLGEYADDRAFLGNHRGNAFVFLSSPEHCETVCAELHRAFALVLPMIVGRRGERSAVHLTSTATMSGGRYDGYAALQAHLGQLRHRSRERVVIEQG